MMAKDSYSLRNLVSSTTGIAGRNGNSNRNVPIFPTRWYYGTNKYVPSIFPLPICLLFFAQNDGAFTSITSIVVLSFFIGSERYSWLFVHEASIFKFIFVSSRIMNDYMHALTLQPSWWNATSIWMLAFHPLRRYLCSSPPRPPSIAVVSALR